MELFQRGWKIKQKKRVPSLILFFRKSEFEFTFFLYLQVRLMTLDQFV